MVDARVTLITDNVHPPSLIEHCDALFCVTSQMGFEALLWGKPVHVFGMPFYAGWGLTQDQLPAPSRRLPVSLERLVYGALVQYPRYRHPETGKRCSVELVLDWLALQRRCRERFPEILYGTRFPFWKRKAIQRFLEGSLLQTVASAEQIPDQATRVVWGSGEARVPVVRMEDGFIRSAGLGVDLTQPQSWVLDDLGLYYDARQPSRLEVMIEQGEFAQDVLERAERLRYRLVASGTTKYNTGHGRWQRPAGQAQVILVPGQVETDASIRYGSPQVKSNLQLLQLVRSVNPNAWLIYKPHPDVVAGVRLEGQHEQQACGYCDEVVTGDDMAHLLSLVDAVHTLTSLTGFEALLRGVDVTCYGQPFYSGWGLTTDINPLARRVRKASLNELVAAALIQYPTYISRVTERFTTVEQVIDEIAEQRRLGGGQPTVCQRFSRRVRAHRRF